MKESDCYEAIETSIDHPNLEVIQVAQTTQEKKVKAQDEYDYAPVCRGIENKLSANMSLKMLEIRYLTLNRSFIQALFSGLATNQSLQILVITHNSLNYAI